MSGGTIGVPRTLGQITAHPVTCYLFGAGKGDPRVLFNKQTNVKDVEVNVTGGWIYGSVFGGGEDGHVMRNVTLNISGNEVDKTKTYAEAYAELYAGNATKIGTWGTSYVDGNVFGGGRGFAGDAYTAGNVAGSVTMNITGGTMLGSVYGGGRLGSVGYGLYDAEIEDPENSSETIAHPYYGTMRPDGLADDGTTAVAGFKRGYIDITISGGTIGNDNEYIMPNADNTPAALASTAVSEWTTIKGGDWDTWKSHNHVPNTVFDPSNGRLLHTKGGNVFAGSMGRRTQLDGVTEITAVDWKKLGAAKQTKLTITGGTIKSNVYGGGEFGIILPYLSGNTKEGGTSTIDIQGGTIGTEVYDNNKADNKKVKYTFGSVYGGGMGDEEYGGGDVRGNATVTMSDGHVWASVFGGGEQATIEGNTYVTISGGEIGKDEVYGVDEIYDTENNTKNPGYVKFGGATMGNVFGAGKGSKDHALNGLVKGNTNITIQNSVADKAYADAHEGVSEGDVLSSPKIYHNVYGGGALASVGDFQLSTGTDPEYIHASGIPYSWTEGTGTATVTITGGTIGISGRDNGMVNGSSRGDISKPVQEGDILVDVYDRVAWVHNSFVNIGTAGASTGPTIKGSVYGGGENGHNSGNATVNVKSGTVGIVDKDDPWIYFADETLRAKVQITRGNVYGAGCGTDTYTDDEGMEQHNQKGGFVAQNTFVNISGGIIANSVYGGGSMGSVGRITNIADTANVAKAKHADIEYDDNNVEKAIYGFGLSWPYKFEFMDGTGKATVNITGGHIGAQVKKDDGTDLFTGDGDVYGSARGEAGDRYATMHFAYANESEVNIDYSTDFAPSDILNYQKLNVPCITGSVHGSGENGFVYGDTKVTLNKGFIGHSLYGGGKGKGTYQVELQKIIGSGKYYANIYSLIAGKVFGNTEVTMNGGYVGRNVYGGGNIASVGKGNYASGVDDYFPAGYGEKLVSGSTYGSGNLWDGESDESKAFMGSGKTTVKVFGGTVGYIKSDPSESIKNNLPYGNVFGGSAGEAAPNVPKDLSPRYHYCPAFFSGYVNETDVTIGGYRCTTAYGEGTHAEGDCITAAEYDALSSDDKANWKEAEGPTILSSVYGGGQDGHVRRDTHVSVVSGVIGLAYNGVTQVGNNEVSYRSVLGNVKNENGTDNVQWLHRGNVYGAGSGISEYEFDFNNDGDKVDKGITIGDVSYDEKGYSTSAGSVTRFTQVDILGGTIHRNVYGGGSMGSVGPLKTKDHTYDPYKPGQANIPDQLANGPGRQSMCTVNIGGGTGIATIGTPNGYVPEYGGGVYGASRGISEQSELGSVIWTQVNIKNGSKIMGNVFGGGDAGMVKKDSEVNVGEKKAE